MSKTNLELRKLIRSGAHRIGEIEIQTDVYGYTYTLCHWLDADLSTEPAFGGLDLHLDPTEARELSIYASDETYRFAKAQTNLKRGWVLALDDEESLRCALNLFYPAAINLFLELQNQTLEIENLRDKLERQTGMYRFAKSISNPGIQTLVQQVCGPAHQCARKILWQIDKETPLEPNEATLFNGIIDPNLKPPQAIPLICREACNHFVAECRKVAKQEFEAK